MRILEVALLAPRPRNPTLGAMVHQKARALARAGHRVDLLAPVRVFPDARLLRSAISPAGWPTLAGNAREWASLWRGARGGREWDGVRYLYRRFVSLPAASRRGENAESFLRTQGRWLETTFSGRPSDLVLGHFLGAAPLVERLARLTGGRPALFVHEDLEHLAAAIGEERVRRRLDSVPLLLTHGARTERQIRRRVGSDRAVVILPSPLDPVFLGPVAPACADAAAPFRLLCVGRFFGLKNQGVVVDALARWRAEGRRPPLRLELSGDRGPSRHRLEREIRRLGLAAEVKVTSIGKAEEVAAALRRSHAMVLPSRLESFSMAALEAAALGVPLLTGTEVGLREELARRGWEPPPSFDVESVDGLLAALGDLVAGYAERRQRALGLRARVVREFTEERFAAALAAAVGGS